ncbi:MAG: TetR/AcrR family transcriptional regulator [Mycobacteriaceae bacterium]|uniref:TetR/AcrR family transcriptional regulator n=1 Tax=Corynebacterium sp. TaxID=1720 RepID=UPI003F9B013F
MNENNPLAKSLQLLWEGLPDHDRGPKRNLSLPQIVDAAVTLADREGLHALSMRSLAQKLGVGTMSLYRYVPSKDELLPLMLDAVVGPTQTREAAVSAGWRAFLTTTATEARRMYLDHPWAIQTNWSRPVLGPASVSDLELFLSGVAGLPLSDREAMNLATAIDSYVLGTVRQELQWINAASESGMSDDDFWDAQGPTLEKQTTSDRFPNLAAVDENSFDASWEDNFIFGLQLIINGVEQLIADRV